MGNGLRMSLARNKTSANRLDIIYDALVVFGVLVVLAVALHHLECPQIHLYGFNYLTANPCREYEGVGLSLIHISDMSR